jgi:hypothetical protein
MSIQINPTSNLQLILSEGNELNIMKDASDGGFLLLQMTIGGNVLGRFPVSQLEAQKFAELLIGINHSRIADLRPTA